MPSRRRSRERALQVLFLSDVRRQTVDEAIEAFYQTVQTDRPPDEPLVRDAFAENLARGAVNHQAEIDERISRHASHWRLERMPAVDRNVLRLAVYEMIFAGTPAPVAIDEALELARKFSNEEAVQFVNGVLDAVRRSGEAGSGQP